MTRPGRGSHTVPASGWASLVAGKSRTKPRCGSLPADPGACAKLFFFLFAYSHLYDMRSWSLSAGLTMFVMALKHGLSSSLLRKVQTYHHCRCCESVPRVSLRQKPLPSSCQACFMGVQGFRFWNRREGTRDSSLEVICESERERK